MSFLSLFVAQVVLTLMQEGQGANGATILSPTGTQEMLTDHAPGGSRYGLGLALSSNMVTPQNLKRFAHTGSHGGFTRARMAGSPGRGEGLVVCINSGSGAAANLREEIYRAFREAYGW